MPSHYGRKRENKGMTSVELGGKKVTFKEGSLRSMLRAPKSVKLDAPLLRRLNKAEIGETYMFRGREIKMTPLMKKRITLGINLQKRKKN